MTKQMGFYIELDRCIGCRSCEIACKQWHATGSKGTDDTSNHRRKIISLESGIFPDVKVINLPLSCMHCANPLCVVICPTAAVSKRLQDGIVVVNKDKCIGCYYCLTACPYGIPRFDVDGIMQKCDFCFDRLEQGQKPVCELTCVAGAIHTGSMEELSEMAGKKKTLRPGGAAYPSILFSK